MNIIRLWEVLTGTPHKHEIADNVGEVARRLSKKAEELSSVIRPYCESEDPLIMLLTDVIIQRGFTAEGSKNEKPQFHP